MLGRLRFTTGCCGSLLVALVAMASPGHASLAETKTTGVDAAQILSQAYQLSGLKDVTQNLAARYLNEALSQKAAIWVGQAITSVMVEHRGPRLRDKLNDPVLRAEMKVRVAARIQEEMPKLAKKVVYERLMQGALSEADPVAQKIVAHMVDAMTTPLNVQIGEWADKASSMAMGQVDQYLKVNISLGRGNVLTLDATDLSGTIDRVVRLDTITNAIAGPMAEALGESTFTNVQQRLSNFLDGELPPEVARAIRLGGSAAEQYLPSAQLGRLKDKMLSLPVITIPNEVYGPVLAGSAARHFALAFIEWPIVNAYELNRGREVTTVMLWQLRNKTGITLNVGQLMDLSQWALGQVGGLSALGQFGRSVGEMADQIAQLESQLKEIEGQLGDGLQSKVAQLESSLKKFQELAATPIRDGIALANATLGDLREALKEQLPTWENFIKLVDAGERSPLDYIGVAEKLKQWNADLADKMADVLVDGAHSLLPKSEIIPEEEIPAQNPSESDDYDPVLLHNGEFVHPVVDVTIPGRGLDFEFKRIYRSRSSFVGRLGWNWTSNFDESLQTWVAPNGPGITWVDGDGRKFFFAARTDQLGRFASPLGVFVELQMVRRSGVKSFEMKARNGAVTRFDHRGLLISKCDRYENCLHYNRTSSGLLSSVTDTVGRRVSLTYDHVGRLQKMGDVSGRIWRYDYDAQGDLVRVTSPKTDRFPSGIVTHYYYSSGYSDSALNHNMTAIHDPRGNLYLRNTYGKSGFARDQVIAQSYGGGNHVVKSRWVMLKPSWLVRTMPDAINVVTNRVDLRDRRGVLKRYWHNAAGNLLKEEVVDAVGRAHLGMRYRYDADGLRVTSIQPGGLRSDYQYQNGQVVRQTVGNRTVNIEYEARWGQPQRRVGIDGVVTEWTYDGRGALQSERQFLKNDPARFIQTLYQNNHFGQRTQLRDAIGIVTEYVYNGANLVKMLRDVSGMRAATMYTHDAVGNIVAIQLPNAGIRRFEVDAQNQIFGETTAMGYQYRYEHDANGNVIAMGVGNHRYTFGYDILDRLIVKDDSVSKTHYAYDVNNQLTEIVWPEGSHTRYTYDAMGRLTQWIKGKPDRVYAQYQYNVDGGLVGTADGAGNLTTIKRNIYGEAIAVESPNGLYQEWDRNAWGLVTAERFRNQKGDRLAETRFTQDALGLQKAISRWDSDQRKWLTTTYHFDEIGQLRRQQLASGATVQRFYDGMGNLERLVLPDGVESRWKYDALGFPKSHIVSDGGVTQFEYDLQGRLVLQRLPNSAQTTYAYDAHDNVTEVHPPETAVIRYVYDAAGRRTVVDAEGRVTRYQWDGNGRLQRLVDPDGKVTIYTYDGEDRLKRMQYPDGGVESYRYDRNDYEIERCLDGQCVSTQVDAMGNVLQRRAHDVSQRMAYDPLGRLVEAIQGQVGVSIQYNSLSQITQAIQGQSKIESLYDDDGFRRSIDSVVGDSVQWQRDALGRVTQVDSGNITVSQSWGLYGPKTLAAENQINTYHYDAMGNVVEQVVGGQISRYRYNLLGDVVLHDDTHYTYDLWEQLLTAGHQRFDYSVTPELMHDQRGNVIRDGQASYRYDSLDRLSSVSNIQGVQIARYYYDALNRRIAKDVLASDGHWVHTDYHYDGWELIGVMEANRRIQYLNSDALDSPVAMRVTTDEVVQDYYLHRDRLGNVVGLGDSHGKIVERYSYDAFGHPETVSKLGNLRLFTGQIYDEETGLYYMRNRYYSPRLKQFMSRDPLGYKATLYSPSSVPTPIGFSFHRSLGAAPHASLPNQVQGWLLGMSLYSPSLTFHNGVGVETNLYTYVGNNPLNETDPLGLYYMRLNRDRGLMYLYAQNGNFIDGWNVGTRGSHRDRLKRLGDTPNGIYDITVTRAGLNYRHPAVTMMVNGKPRTIGPESYGLGYIGLKPTLIEPGAEGRSGLAIHGGGAGLKDALENTHQKLISTYGCVRMHNDDIIRLVDQIHQLESLGDTEGTLLVYSGLSPALSDPFNERVRSDYRYLPGAVGNNARVLH